MYKIEGPKGPIWFNEKKSFVESLSHGSHKVVNAVCSMCDVEREASYCNILRAGHSYCQGCSRTIGAYAKMIGHKYGKLTVDGFGPPYVTSDGKRNSTFICTCECGNKTTPQAASVKDGSALSCGCLIKETSSETCKKRIGEASPMFGRTGVAHPNYNFDLTDKQRKERKFARRSSQHIRWSSGVKARDKCCAICDATENLEAHHLEGFADNVDLRFVLENGITLCVPCHEDYHSYLKRKKLKSTKGTLNAYILEKKNSKSGRIKKSLSSLFETLFGN